MNIGQMNGFLCWKFWMFDDVNTSGAANGGGGARPLPKPQEISVTNRLNFKCQV